MASDERRRRIRERIAALGDDERRQLYKKAARLRRASKGARAKPRNRPDYEHLADEDEPLPALEKRRRRHKGSLRAWAEALVEDGDLGTGEVLTGPAPDDAGLVLFATAGRCRVLLDSGEVRDCSLVPDLASFQRRDLAVGDRVDIAHASEASTIVGVRARKSVLSRPDSGPGGRLVERVVAANVDWVVVVAAAVQPPLRPRLLDRYLVAARHGGSDFLIAITKLDLLSNDEREVLAETLAPYRSAGVPVVLCSCTQGTGIGALREALQGGLAVFVGQSGVGKSSLLNALEPELAIETGETGRNRKGTHTTTASTLHRLPGDTRVIDTPGVREFGLWQVSRAALRETFHEFDAWSEACRYRDCAHAREPGCAVRLAVERGDVASARYESYLRLVATLSDSG